MDAKRFIARKVEESRLTVGGSKAHSALSGGVDSAVCTLLAQRALGEGQRRRRPGSGLPRPSRS